jgi:hypothetical protein
MIDDRQINALRPTLHRRYPLKRSASYDKDFARAVHNWFLSYNLLPDEAQRHALEITNFPYVTAVCWPACDRTRLFDLACLTVALNVLDHELDTHRGRVHELARDLLDDLGSGCSRCSDRRWGPVFADIWRRLEIHLSPAFMTRFGATIAEHLHGCVNYDRYLRTHGQPRDVTHYMALRTRTVGQAIDHRMVEISLDVDLPRHITNHPLVQRLCSIDIRRTVLAQDILSAVKELLDGEQENIVAVIAMTQRCTLPHAMDRASAAYVDEMDRFDQAHKQLLTSNLGQDEQLRRWTAGLNDFHAGLLDWSSGSPRYTLGNTSTWSRPDMIIAGGHGKPDRT